jgi:transglutaminase-like putative cysteine protease
VVLVYLMALAVAWAIDDAVWFLGDEAITDYLQAAAIGGVTVSLIAVIVGWGRWTGHLIGAAFAALLIPLWVGERMAAAGAWPHELFRATADQHLEAVIQLIDQGRVTSSQFGPTLLIYGVLVWGTSMFASTAVFRHRRPLPAIVSLGLLLVVNMAVTPADQLRYLVLFCGAALLLLVRLHAVDEQAAWLRARLGDPRPVRSHTIRAGSGFVLAALIGSFVLTQTAASAPLESSLPDDLETGIVDFGRELSAFFPFVTSVKGPAGLDFSGSAPLNDRWQAEEGPAFTAVLPAGTPRNLYWRAANFDQFTKGAWQPASEISAEVGAGGNVLELIADPMVAPARLDVTATITPAGVDRVASVPGLPFRFDQPVDVAANERSSSLVRVFLSNRGVPYTVDAALLSQWSEQNPAGVSGNKLSALGRDLYTIEPAIFSQHTQLPETGVLGPVSRQFLAEVREAAGDNPYGMAVEIERRFRDEFTYMDDISHVECGGDGVVECFVRTKVGYCMYFATAMIELLREDQIPARLVMGFLPGERTPVGDGTVVEAVNKNQAHAWVEVFFPGWGWIAFDPTATRGVEGALPAGPEVAVPSPGAPASLPPLENKFLEGLGGRPGPPTEAGSDRGGIGPVMIGIIGLLIVAIVTAIVVARVRTRRRSDIGVAEAYRRMVGMATRLGYGPRPSQTVYEYAEAIGTLVPTAKVDLMTVATARVETTYARRQLGQDRLAAVADAARRLRISLLRLFFRRSPRGPRPTRR